MALARVTVTVNRAAVTTLARRVGVPTVTRLAGDTARAAARLAPRETGQLASAHRVTLGRLTTTGRSASASVRNIAPYSLHVHDGTGRWGPTGQPIRPRRAKAMRWFDFATGDQVFARQTQGQPPKPFLSRGYNQAAAREPQIQVIKPMPDRLSR